MKTTASPLSRLLLACLFSVSAGAYAAPIFVPNNQPTGWVGEVGESSFNFMSGTETVFKGDYVKGSWTGNLFAFPVDENGTLFDDAERWSGGVAPGIDATAATSRRIVTMRSDGTKIPFVGRRRGRIFWRSVPRSNQRGRCHGPLVLNYIRGDHSRDPTGRAPAPPR
jgi:hypothetical protein